MRAIHAEGAARKLDHSDIRDICRAKFGVQSMAELNNGQLQTLYKDWTGRGLRGVKREKTPLQRGYAQGKLEMVSPAELETLERAFAARQWGPETKRAFIRRQLKGREAIRTRADFARVFRGIQAMNRRDRFGF
jgi:hypothetical protein